jgi:hypothetical protein
MDSGSLAWELRCEIREQLIAFIPRNYPASLPPLRASFEKTGRSSGRYGHDAAVATAPADW